MRITLKEFKKNVSLYGADFNLWHGFDAAALRTFMQENEKALALYLDAQSLETQLDDFSVPALNLDVVRAAKAQIIREDVQERAPAARKLRTLRLTGDTGFWGGALKPAYAMASLIFVVFVVTMLSFGSFGDEKGKAASFDVASALNEIETLATQSATQQELIVAFAEIEKEQAINNFMDYIILEFDDTLMEDAIVYLYQEG
jgi:hypothetical protein